LKKGLIRKRRGKSFGGEGDSAAFVYGPGKETKGVLGRLVLRERKRLNHLTLPSGESQYVAPNRV